MCVQCTFTIQWAKCPWADVGCSWPLHSRAQANNVNWKISCLSDCLDLNLWIHYISWIHTTQKCKFVCVWICVLWNVSVFFSARFAFSVFVNVGFFFEQVICCITCALHIIMTVLPLVKGQFVHVMLFVSLVNFIYYTACVFRGAREARQKRTLSWILCWTKVEILRFGSWLLKTARA